MSDLAGKARAALVWASVLVLSSGCASLRYGRPEVTTPAPASDSFSSASAAHSNAAPEPVEQASQVDATLPVDPVDTLWMIDAGTYAGMKIPLSVSAAIRGRKAQGFWRIAPGLSSPGGIVGWKSTRYPIPVAFRHSSISGTITPADSAAFWTIIDEMNADFGIPLFRPASTGKEDPPDVIVVDLGVLPEADGLSRLTWGPSGEVFDVRVTFHDVSALHDSHIVMHEMMHALGFGHTTAWVSIVAPHDHTTRVTAEDVAYAELAMHTRIAREWADTRHLIALAVSRQPAGMENRVSPFCDVHSRDILTEDDPFRIPELKPAAALTVVSSCAADAVSRK